MRETPSASPPRMSARWEQDLSPGARRVPDRDFTGVEVSTEKDAFGKCLAYSLQNGFDRAQSSWQALVTYKTISGGNPLAAPELGTKQLCPQCEAKFYDLNKRPAVCPKCEHSFELDEEEALSVRAKVKAAAPVPGKDDAEAEDAEDAEAAVATDEDEDGEEETIAELGTEEDTIVTDLDDDEDDAGKTVPAGFTEQGVDDDDILADDDDAFDIEVDAALDGDDDLAIDEDETK